MRTAENAAPAPTRAQAENAASAMLNVANARENLVTRLKVARYASWRARFDGMRGSRASAGIANARLFRGSEDTVVVLADIPGFRDALAWADGGPLSRRMKRRGRQPSTSGPILAGKPLKDRRHSMRHRYPGS